MLSGLTAEPDSYTAKVSKFQIVYFYHGNLHSSQMLATESSHGESIKSQN